MNLNQMVLIGFLAYLGAGVLFIGVHLLRHLLLRLQASRSRARVVQVHGDVVINATVLTSRRHED